MKGYDDLVRLIADVNAHNTIATDSESICDMQDMIAHSDDEQLTALANDDRTRFAFYWIYSIAYRVDTVLAFYTKHDNKITNLRLKVEELTDELDNANERIRSLKNDLEAEKNIGNDEYEMRVSAENKNKSFKAEIIELKAKLYDLITK